MQTIYSKFVLCVGALALAVVIVPYATAQCGLSIKAIKPSSWQPGYGEAYQTMVLADWHEDREPIVGMWHVIFTAQTMNNAPFSAVIDNSVVVWHRDGTEIMNSSRPAQDGNFCLGVWTRTGKLTYYLNHIPWAGNDPENAPSGIGNPQGGAQLTEKVTLNPDGNSYHGHFTLDAYDTSGNLTVSFTGVLKAKRITTSSSFGDVFNQQ
jgi:hypothetical protein